MQTIYKYPLKVADRQTISLLKNSQILTIQNQKGIPCLWALVDPDELEFEERVIYTYGTGHKIEISEDEINYIGTYQLAGGDLVFHVFEKVILN